MNIKATDEELEAEIRRLAPWHHDIQITEGISTGLVFAKTRTLLPSENDGVSLISPRASFGHFVETLYPNSMSGVRFLDCACNAGAYCFLARENDAEFAYGFDVREHWIDQGHFVQENCTVQPVDRIQLQVADLYDLPKKNLEPFDFTYFSGIFYHLPDPISGLKIAADLTKDVLVVSTLCADGGSNPLGMTIKFESVDNLMSGVHKLAWMPNSPEALALILGWMGFVDIKLMLDVKNEAYAGRRIQLIASRTKGRLKSVYGHQWLAQRFETLVEVEQHTAQNSRNSPG